MVKNLTLLPFEARLMLIRHEMAYWDVPTQTWMRHCRRCHGVVSHLDGEATAGVD